MDALVDLLPEHNSLKKSQNQLRRVLDLSVGEWFDNHSIQALYDNLFLMSAVGGYLDCHGRDYGVYRQADESDEDYRERIILEKLDHLTPYTLSEQYSVRLYNYVTGFNLQNNTLTSDNPYCTDFYMGVVDEDTRKILDFKFTMDNGVVWLTRDDVDYIFNTSNKNVLKQYLGVYPCITGDGYFYNFSSIKQVKLMLPYVSSARGMFCAMDGLTDIDLSLPNATDCRDLLQGDHALVNAVVDIPKSKICTTMFENCDDLVNVTLNAPNMEASALNYGGLFYGCSSLEYINVNVPEELPFEEYIAGLELESLETLIINGEEITL